jgi:hypothetical protein
LRGQHAEGEAGVDEPVRKLAGGALAAGDDLVRKPELLRVRHALVDARERASVVKEQYLAHVASLS